VLAQDAVDRALAGWFADRDTGRHQLAAVAPLYGDGPGYERIEGNPLAMPASTTKVVTAAVALKVLGPERRFTTRTTLDTSTRVPQLILIGGGDPYLTSERHEPGTSVTFDPDRASLEELAERTARQLRRREVTRVQLGYDATLFTGPGGHHTWVEDPDLEVGAYIEDEVIAPISALWADQGQARRGWGCRGTSCSGRRAAGTGGRNPPCTCSPARARSSNYWCGGGCWPIPGSNWWRAPR
jgi:D-alanyl-D-alanine carboxypeptidase/D-alanyl-D-alanine-endopeptidase (penicillin-binding protein 4)